MQKVHLQDYSIYKLSAADYLREGSIGAAISGLVAYTFYKSRLVFIILLPLSYLIFPLMRKEKLKSKRSWNLNLQFKEAIWVVSGFLSAGMSVENAFEMAIPELIKLYGEHAMIVNEFRIIVKGVRINKPIEKMLNDFARRSALPDIKNFTEVFAIAKRNGGSLKDIIERTGRIIRDKTEVTEDIKNMTASKRYEQNIMNVLPFGIIVYINLTSNGFLDVMYDSLPGRCIMTVCLLMIAASYYLSQRILDIRI